MIFIEARIALEGYDRGNSYTNPIFYRETEHLAGKESFEAMLLGVILNH